MRAFLFLLVPVLSFGQTEARLHPTQVGLFGASNGDFLRANPANGGGEWSPTASIQGTLLLPSGSSGNTLRHNGSSWIANSFLYNSGTAIGVGTTSPGETIELATGGIKLPTVASALSDRTFYYTDRELIRFGPNKEIEKCWTKQIVLSQNTNWAAGSYWDILSIPYAEFGFCRVVVESSGAAHGSFREIRLPYSYANDLWNAFGISGTNDTWYLCAEQAYYGRDWGARFINQFKIAVRVNAGTISFRLVAITAGEIRGATFDYGNCTINLKFFLSESSSLSSIPTVPNTNGTGMTVPTAYLPAVVSGPNGRTVFRNGVGFGENVKSSTPPTNGILVEGNTIVNANIGVGTTSPLAKVHVNGAVGLYAGGGSSLFLGDPNFDNSGFWNRAPGLTSITNAGTGVASDLGLYYYNSGTRTLGAVLTYQGNLGINQSVPAHRLDVTGGARFVTSNNSFLIDCSTATTSPAQPLIVRGRETGFATRFLEFQDSSSTWRFRATANSSLITLVGNGRNVEMNGSTYSRLSSGSSYIEANSGGYIGLAQVTSDPGSPVNSSIWGNTTDNRLKQRFSNGTQQVATVEQDFVGNAVATRTSNFTLSAQDFHLVLDANGGSFTVTLDGTMREGVFYTFECRRNGTNTISFDAGAGYNLAFPGISSFPDDGTVPVGGAGTGDQAPHRNYSCRRMGTNIIFQ